MADSNRFHGRCHVSENREYALAGYDERLPGTEQQHSAHDIRLPTTL